MNRLILVRHGQSAWNLENLFTGWTDVDLSAQGIAEARKAGAALKAARIKFDIAFTSVLKRAVETLHLIEEEAGNLWVPEFKTWRLNERHYGALQGLNKADTAEKYGEEQVQIWRRSFDTPPPLLEENDPRNAWHEEQYSEIDRKIIPRGESLKDCIARVIPYWQDSIAPAILDGKTPIISAHGNSLRGLVKYLTNMSDEDITGLEIPTGRPQIFELDGSLNVLKNYYL